MAVAVLSTWGVLIVVLLAPSPLPEQWRYYIYSPASVGLWMFSMLVVPVLVCVIKWEWIKKGNECS
ncbi:hypothetical protein BGK67_00180 [Streptomyces subrutilus]|uniref:Uncharacterized protein n=1 Tax=Streptomyces subrutilus TaxID=36818 RepID=A0A1E5Q0M0_9ACTN|nr:hypothetical protein BGK67_00180 [Streptomyces subrutilus]